MTVNSLLWLCYGRRRRRGGGGGLLDCNDRLDPLFCGRSVFRRFLIRIIINGTTIAVHTFKWDRFHWPPDLGIIIRRVLASYVTEWMSDLDCTYLRACLRRMPVNICAKSIDSLIVSPTDGRVSFARVTISSSGVVGCWVLVRSLIVPTTAVVVVVKPQFPADRKVVTKKPGQATSQNVQVNSVKLYYHKPTQSERLRHRTSHGFGCIRTGNGEIK